MRFYQKTNKLDYCHNPAAWNIGWKILCRFVKKTYDEVGAKGVNKGFSRGLGSNGRI